MLAMVRPEVPELLRVTVWAALVELTLWVEKVRAEGNTLAIGAVAVPEAFSMAMTWPLRRIYSLLSV